MKLLEKIKSSLSAIIHSSSTKISSPCYMDGEHIPLNQIIEILRGQLPPSSELNDWTRLELVQVASSLVKCLYKLKMQRGSISGLSLSDFTYNQGRCSVKLSKKTTHLTSRLTMAPEVLRGGEKTATPDADLFSSAILIYQILTLGHHPYTCLSKCDTVENMKNGLCPLGPFSDCEMSESEFLVWKSLPYRCKSDFIKTFQQGNQHAHLRTSLSEWVKNLDCYSYDIKAEHVNNSLFPEELHSNDIETQTRYI